MPPLPPRSAASLLAALALSASACHQSRVETPQAAEYPTPAQPEPGRSVKIQQITLASGLIIEDVAIGTGDLCLPDATVRLRYTCRLSSGVQVDSSGDGAGEYHLPRMIRGWQDGLPGMRVGGKRRLTVPADLGYGSRSVRDARGNEVIPPGSVLHYEIDLLGLVQPSAAPAGPAAGV